MTETCRVEIRETAGRPRLVGVILQEGHAARCGRAELFAPGSVVWTTGSPFAPSTGGAPRGAPC